MEWRLKRGEIWTLAGGPGFAGKPRPVLILQSDEFAALESVTFCGFTSDQTYDVAIRPRIAPDESNHLNSVSDVMIDKITTAPVSRLGKLIGVLSREDVANVDQALLTFLGLLD